MCNTVKKPKTIKPSACKSALVFLLALLFGAKPALARDHSNSLMSYLAQEKAELSVSIKTLEDKGNPGNLASYQKASAEIKTLQTLNRARIVTLQGFLHHQRKRYSDLSARLRKLQELPLQPGSAISAQEKADALATRVDITKQTIALIEEALVLAEQYQKQLDAYQENVSLWFSQAKLDGEMQGYRRQEQALQTKLDNLFMQSSAIQQKLKVPVESGTSLHLQSMLLVNTQEINLTELALAGIKMDKQLARADLSMEKQSDLKTLQQVLDLYKTLLHQLKLSEDNLSQLIEALSQEYQQLAYQELKPRIAALKKQANVLSESAKKKIKALDKSYSELQQQVAELLSTRQTLTEYALHSWPKLIQQLAKIPGQFYGYLKNLSILVRDNYHWLETWQAIVLWLGGLAISFVFGFLAFQLRRFLKLDTQRRWSGQLFSEAAYLVYKNIAILAALALSLFVFYMTRVTSASYQLFITLLLLVLVYRGLGQIAQRMLLNALRDAEGRDLQLYNRLKWLLLAGFIVSLCMIVGYQLSLKPVILELFDRLLMLFVLVVSVVLWRSREGILHLFDPVLEHSKRYLKRAVKLLVYLLPWTLLSTAVLGLVGYLNLAWTMSTYQIQLLFLIALYVLFRGFLFDVVALASDIMMRRMHNGWLWIEVFLKPIDKIMRVLLMFVSLLVLLKVFSVSIHSPSMEKLKALSQHPILDVSGIYITARSTLYFLILVAFLSWLTRWTREFSFRWLYRNIKDLGIRNSLSVFTQYSVVIIGAVIALRVLGFDFSGMSMVLGGLAVGMGFGLRDFASNVVGGIMLLIERPVREGDLVSIGDYEGRVAHIGLRSMRVCSWDNMEVLVPNAETFNKPFTNWTHQDSIIRTVVPIKVSRSDDPVLVQRILSEVLTQISEILTEPPSQVFLKEVDESLMSFEVRYFINIEKHSRVEVRSKVLFAIVEAFDKAGIKAPVPSMAIEVQDSKTPDKDGDPFRF